MTASKRFQVPERAYVVFSVALLVAMLAVIAALIPSSFGSTNNLRANDGACYRVSGVLPNGYTSAQDFYNADPARAEQVLLMQLTSCQEEMPGLVVAD